MFSLFSVHYTVILILIRPKKSSISQVANIFITYYYYYHHHHNHNHHHHLIQFAANSGPSSGRNETQETDNTSVFQHENCNLRIHKK